MAAYAGGQDGPTPNLWWQASVDFLYRNLVCELIEPNSIHADFPIGNPLKLSEIFASSNPKEALFWFYIQFNGASTLIELIKSHNLLDWAHLQSPLALNFMREIECIYTRKGVSLSKDVLIPIRSGSAA